MKCVWSGAGICCSPHYLFRDGFVLELGRQVEDGFHRETLDVFGRNVKEIKDTVELK